MASKRRNMFQKNKTQETTENEQTPLPHDLGGRTDYTAPVVWFFRYTLRYILDAGSFPLYHSDQIGGVSIKGVNDVMEESLVTLPDMFWSTIALAFLRKQVTEPTSLQSTRRVKGMGAN
ncbi:hypothetical protein AAG570_011131 [Ranatra chinensis]|uniref:Uncharacterized protein n=1 Tax=Ranatra chinensis TaxID=642074 RepID=A0ABD0YJZ7_9HEMI